MLIHIANVTWTLCKTSLKSQSISQIHLIYNFKGAQPDHVRVQSASCYVPRELVSFIRPRELERFNPRHVTRSPPIRKRIWVGRCNNREYFTSRTIYVTNVGDLKSSQKSHLHSCTAVKGNESLRKTFVWNHIMRLLLNNAVCWA